MKIVKLIFITMLLLTIMACTTKSNADSLAFEEYQRGLKDGKIKGYGEGQTEGYQKGYDVGYDEGYNKGYEKGYHEGYNEACDETQNAKVEEVHGYREHTRPVSCSNCGGDGFIDGITTKEICHTCKGSGVIQITEKEYY